jgi:glycerol uptake facilitator-like aquaporin
MGSPVTVTSFLAEIVGTFIFMLVILNLLSSSNTINTSNGTIGIGALIIGLGFAVSIYITAGLGGVGHLNPVSTGVAALNGDISATDALLLILAQIIGGGLAFLVYWGMGANKD